MCLKVVDTRRGVCLYNKLGDWVFASKRRHGRKPIWGQAILRKYIRPVAQRVGIQKRFGWHTFRHTYSTLLRSVGTEFKVMQELAPFLVAIYVGCLHAGDLARKTCGAGSRARPGIRS